MRRVFVAVAAAVVFAAVLLAKLAGAFGDDAARTAVAKLESKSASAETLVAPAADAGFRTAGTSLDDELVDAVQVWGESACNIVGYIETIERPPTWDELLMVAGPAGVRAFSETQALYDASRRLAPGELTLGEIRQFYCAAPL